jgi:hypothetical protein
MTKEIVLTNQHPMLTEQEQKDLATLNKELMDTADKVQGYRTPTEMRFSVLDDHRHPTAASKYWQAVREQNAHYTQLILLSFEYRSNEVKIMKAEEDLKTAEKETDRLQAQIEIDKWSYIRSTQQHDARERMKELLEWSKIKEELVKEDPTFDTQNVNTHQAESYILNLEWRAKALTPGSSQGEVLNVLGPLNTLRRMLGKEIRKPEEDVPFLNQPSQQLRPEVKYNSISTKGDTNA